MPRCAFLTMQETEGWSIDADLAFEPLAELGWHAEWLPWRQDGVNWDEWDCVYLAATWDYPVAPDEFLAVMSRVDASRAVLVNPLSLVRWNVAKTYLRELSAQGVRIVPSLWFESLSDDEPATAFDAFGTDRIVIKPVVSTNANNTFLLTRAQYAERRAELGALFANRAFVVQPFLRSVQSEGEYSLFYIGDGFSHAIRKVPRPADFRVQEEHGASIVAFDLSDELIAAGQNAIRALISQPLYGRVDFVRADAGELCLMELELIEPSLYLRTNDEAAARFAHALDEYARRKGVSEHGQSD